MNILTNLFSSGAKELVGTVGEVVDNLVTSDEERLTLKNAIETAIMTHIENMGEQVLAYDKEISDRHKADMASDSWLSKNVRPMTLIFLTSTTVFLAYLTIFLLPVEKVALLTPWITLLTTLLVVVYAFYFGSRGIEKVQKIKKEQ
jgi:hypothetical protein